MSEALGICICPEMLRHRRSRRGVVRAIGKTRFVRVDAVGRKQVLPHALARRGPAPYEQVKTSRGRKSRNVSQSFPWSSGRKARRAAGLFLVGLGLPILPVAAVNSIRSGSLAFVSSSAPYNFSVGNVHDAPGDVPWTSPYYFKVKASGPPETIHLFREALADIRSHPLD